MLIDLFKINRLMYLLEKKGLNCWIDGPVLFIRKTEGDFVKQRAELIENLSLMVVEPEFIAEEIEREI